MKLEYNYLNLTGAVRDISDNPLAAYRWLADGTKVGVVDDDGAGFEYVGSLIYKRNGSGLALESAAFGSGRIMVSEGSSGAVFTPNYFITDHLGSTRAVVEADGTVSERNDYLPFGGRWEVSGAAITDNRFRFSGKEDQTTGNLPYQDFGARFLGKKLPIWTSVDPLAEKYYSISPYVYCKNNPIRHIDTDGRIPLDIIWDAGNMLYDIGAAVVNHIKGDHKAARSNWADLGLDAAAFLIPYVPAGATKALKAADKAIDAAKTVDKATDAVRAVGKGSDASKAIDKGFDAQKAIGPIGDPSGQVTKQLPESMRGNAKTANSGKGTIFKDPANPKGNHVRTMEGNPRSEYPAQQKPYVKETRNGKSIDANGVPVHPDSPEAHIPRDEYRYKGYGE